MSLLFARTRIFARDRYLFSKVKDSHPKANPNRLLIEAIRQGGVKLFDCQVAMKPKGHGVDDLLPFCRVVVSGIGALVNFEKSGYLPITP